LRVVGFTTAVDEDEPPPQAARREAREKASVQGMRCFIRCLKRRSDTFI